MRGHWRSIQLAGGSSKEVPRHYAIVRDFLRAAREVFREAWGKEGYMVTKAVTLKALIRVCADLAREDAEPDEGRQERWEERLAPWSDMTRQFRDEGFYERFPARGEIERVAKIHRELAKAAKIEISRPKE